MDVKIRKKIRGFRNMHLSIYSTVQVYSRRRIKTEEKAKVATAVWGAESIYFLAALAILYQDDLKNRMNCTRTI